jgi:hypothetical protein
MHFVCCWPFIAVWFCCPFEAKISRRNWTVAHSNIQLQHYARDAPVRQWRRGKCKSSSFSWQSLYEAYFQVYCHFLPLLVLGDCVKMLNDNFPWIHIVKGRPRHSQSQGSIEWSHAPYKQALAQAMTDANTSNWLAYIYVVQCAINNCPVQCLNNLSPYTMYYARPNRNSYSSMLQSVGDIYLFFANEYMWPYFWTLLLYTSV